MAPKAADPADEASSEDEAPTSQAASGSLVFPSNPPTAPYEAYIHEAVYTVGRQFGFQAFNLNPDTKGKEEEEWVPATVFVASDHLVQVLGKNMYPRCTAEGDPEYRFQRAVWDLHSRIFRNYFAWCKHVNLPPRPSPQSSSFKNRQPFTDEAVIVLMNELALYFCIYTEAANMRYMPEGLCFIFWTMRFSPKFAELRGNGDRSEKVAPVPTDPEVIVPNLRHERQHLRRVYWSFVENARIDISGERRDMDAAEVSRRSGVDEYRSHLLLEIIVNGDGGAFTDEVVQPVFHFLANEAVYKLDNFTTNIACFQTNPSADDNELSEDTRKECDGMTRLIAAHSSVLLTHAMLTAMERLAAGYLSAGVQDPRRKRERSRQMRRKHYTDLEAPADDGNESDSKGKKRKKAKEKRPSIKIEGQPFGLYLSGIVWTAIFIAMLAVFTFQFLKPESVGVTVLDKSAFEFYWRFASAVYFLCVLIHGLSSTRDGYTVSFSNMVTCGCWPLGGYSLRGKPRNEISAKLETSWRAFFWNAGFWLIVLALKCTFDYIFIIAPLTKSLDAISREGWLDSLFPDDLEILGTSITLPNDADFVLMIARSLPSFMIVLVDTSVFYIFGAVAFGMIRGLMVLNLGVVGNWSEVQNEFQR
eukprot:evm.model.scf_2302.2 EVM.evm.TU.scf_2302.2   scf_2302:9712-17129(+)